MLRLWAWCQMIFGQRNWGYSRIDLPRTAANSMPGGVGMGGAELTQWLITQRYIPCQFLDLCLPTASNSRLIELGDNIFRGRLSPGFTWDSVWFECQDNIHWKTAINLRFRWTFTPELPSIAAVKNVVILRRLVKEATVSWNSKEIEISS